MCVFFFCIYAFLYKTTAGLATQYFKAYLCKRASQVALLARNTPANAGDARECGLDPWVWKIPLKRAWQPTPVFLPGESDGQRSLVDYSP